VPDAAGRFKGISVPELPWRTEPEQPSMANISIRDVIHPCGTPIRDKIPKL
jgi:hypothetical protein